jgi:hypothetical protein
MTVGKQGEIMKAYGKLTARLIAAWFVFALSASALHLFANASQRIGLSVALAAGIPVIFFLGWLIASADFRKFVLSLNPRVLTYLQTWRIVGVVFVILEARQLLPAVFARPAGYGDIFVGATAWLAASWLAKPANRALFIFWQTLGIADLVAAVTLGVTARLISAGGPTMYPMTVLPLSLIPTFLVPLFLMIHVISIAQATKWRAPSVNSQRSGRVLGSAAA